MEVDEGDVEELARRVTDDFTGASRARRSLLLRRRLRPPGSGRRTPCAGLVDLLRGEELERAAGGRHGDWSAGNTGRPRRSGGHHVMRELGFDLADRTPELLTSEL